MTSLLKSLKVLNKVPNIKIENYSKNTIKHKNYGDFLLLIIPVLLSLFGALMVYSASKYSAEISYGNKFYFLKKQLIGVSLGAVAMIFTANFNYVRLKKIRYPLLIISLVALVLVFTPFGVENYGAKRWIKFFGITIQPSEIVKFAFAVYAAAYFSNKPERALSFAGLLPVLGVGGGICVLIMLEPNMSITVCVGAIMLIMLFVAGVKFRHLAIIIAPLLVLAPVLIIIEPYRLKRLLAFINPWASPKGEGYQLLQSLYALGSGGLFGTGLFKSRQKYRFLPFAESDFILSIIGEELGFFGAAILFIAIGFLVYRGLVAAARCKTYFGTLLGIGIISVFAVQAGVNALVVTGSIPPTGLPLPLISSGNTSIIVFLAAFGVLYNLSRDKDEIFLSGL